MYDFTAFREALQKNDSDFAIALIIDLNPINIQDQETGDTALHIAVSSLNLPVVNYLIKKDINVDFLNNLGDRAIDIVIRNLELPNAKEIFPLVKPKDFKENKGEYFNKAFDSLIVNFINEDHARSETNSISGVNGGKKNNGNQLANDQLMLMEPSHKLLDERVEKISKHSKQPTFNDSQFDEELQRAIELSKKENQYNLPLKNQTTNGDSDTKVLKADEKTLHEMAVSDDNIKAIKYLISQGVDVNVKNKEGDTALHIAVINECEKIVKLLLKQKNINPIIQNDEGNTPVHLAMQRGEEDEISMDLEEYCINNKIEYENITNKKGQTPEDVAKDLPGLENKEFVQKGIDNAMKYIENTKPLETQEIEFIEETGEDRIIRHFPNYNKPEVLETQPYIHMDPNSEKGKEERKERKRKINELWPTYFANKKNKLSNNNEEKQIAWCSDFILRKNQR